MTEREKLFREYAAGACGTDLYKTMMFNKIWSAAAGASEGQAPVAWVRYRSDGGFEGPIMDTDSRMCDTRRSFWTPLYTHPSAEIAALRERIAGMEKDAERWRELVKLAVANGCWWIKFDFENHDGPLTAEQMNDGIDAAIAKEKHP